MSKSDSASKIDYPKRLREDLARRLRAFRVELHERSQFQLDAECVEKIAQLVEAGEPWARGTLTLENVDTIRRELRALASDANLLDEEQEKAAQLCNALSDERRRRVAKKPPKRARKGAEEAAELDVTIGRLRVRCAAAVTRDPENCLVAEFHEAEIGDVLQPGDLLLEEGQGDDWHGGVVIRSADREELARRIADRGGP